MDVLILNFLGDIPIVTKFWTVGCIALSILTTTNIIDPTRGIYNYDLVFKKGQYGRIIYSIFDYGNFDIRFLLNLYIKTTNLTMLENSIGNSGRYVWIIVLILTSTILMTCFEQPIYSLGSIMTENLVYYQLRKNPNGMNFRLLAGFNISPLVAQLYMNVILYFVLEKSLLQVAMTFIPGHIIFYLDDILGNIYNIDVCKSPYDWWIERNRANNRSTIIEHDQND